jgi:hypothetical protein
MLHLIWFVLWILANQGYIGVIQGFDEYPYGLLGIILTIEAVLVTGFLLISQNHQFTYSKRRAELDYEIIPIPISCYLNPLNLLGNCSCVALLTYIHVGIPLEKE